MKVLRIRPRQYPEIVEIEGSLESLQNEVDGPIQACYPWDDPVALICNEEGKLLGCGLEQFNRTLMDDGVPLDIIAGTFLIVGLTEEDFGDLAPEFLEKYEKLFHRPEKFLRTINEQGETHLVINYCDPE